MHKLLKRFLFFSVFCCLSAWMPSRSVAVGVAPSLEDEARDGLATSSREFQALVRSASDKLKRRDYKGAEADYTRILELVPRSITAYSLRGFAKELDGDLDGAAADFGQAIALGPEHAIFAYQNRGNVRAKKGDPAGAAADYRHALKINPKYDPAYTGLGGLKQTAKDYAGAEADYTRALALDAKDGAAWSNRAAIRYQLGRYADAVADIDRTISLDPKDASNYTVRGNCEHRQGDQSAAIRDFRHAAELDPTRTRTFYTVAHLEAQEGRYAAALEDVQRALPQPAGRDEDYPQILAWTLRKHLGRAAEADERLAAHAVGRRHDAGSEWPGHIVAFLLGRESEDALLAQAASGGDAKKVAGQRCEACYYAGIKKLFSGDKAAAAEYFRRSLATEQKTFVEYELAQAELQSL